MKSVEQLREGKGTFSVGQAIGDGWNLVSRHLGYYIGAGLLAVLISMAAGFIPILGGLANNLILTPCFSASAIFITWQISKGHAWTDFGAMFKGFNYLGPALVSTLIMSLISFALLLLCFFSFLPELYDIYKLSQGSGAYRNQDEIAALLRAAFFNGKAILLIVLFIIAMLLLNATWAFRLHFIVVYKMEAWPAMELSRKVCTSNIFPLVGLFIILGLIVMVSAIPCGIGLLFSLPLSIGAVYSAFAQITGSDQPDEISGEMFDFINDANKGGQPGI
ncbi:MAG: hypothetical protein U0V75_16780 [Ferruginibacter sp.]